MVLPPGSSVSIDTTPLRARIFPRPAGRHRPGGDEPHAPAGDSQTRGDEEGARPAPQGSRHRARGPPVVPQSLDPLGGDEPPGLCVHRLQQDWSTSLDVDYLEIEILPIESLDVK
jgi:hypothetical protein